MGARLTVQTKRVREPLLETGNQASFPGEEGNFMKFFVGCLLMLVSFYFVLMASENPSVVIVK